MFAYQKNQRFFAQIAHGLEQLGLEELHSLGAQDAKAAYRGVYFTADRAALYRINYCSRLSTHILAPLLTFDCHSDRYLYKTALKLAWPEILSVSTTFAITANVSNSRIRHSQYAARKLKDAIVDQFREICGERPNVAPRHPDVWLNLYIHNNKATISLDTSGGSLHRRGYRRESVSAPMQETLAAAIIRLSGWQGEQPLYDPMCGSGSLLAEACMAYCRVPAGYLRQQFGFEHMPDFDHTIWKSVRQESNRHIRPLPPGLIGGSDLDHSAIEAAQKNCRQIPGGTHIALRTQRFHDLQALKERTIVCNPPYGLRLQQRSVTRLLQEFGDFLTLRCQGSNAYIYLGNASLFTQIPLRPSWKKALHNGGLEGFLAKYSIRQKGRRRVKTFSALDVL
ncbi:RNA methyltransferase [candidate division KSB3 bacterium]|uniref:RNA methyltransferase n=1 Tax=candidate division KSB3 bacterium TaxID=2044937 RepID=A0A2G6E5Y4_9BACT|nr:MAG: RNA methyltransferase [candidate division KSB3 bacterium]PIE29876.1 MAG: RNA methyltransferase [candidate division KSB3 bacterium]